MSTSHVPKDPCEGSARACPQGAAGHLLPLSAGHSSKAHYRATHQLAVHVVCSAVLSCAHAQLAVSQTGAPTSCQCTLTTPLFLCACRCGACCSQACFPSTQRRRATQRHPTTGAVQRFSCCARERTRTTPPPTTIGYSPPRSPHHLLAWLLVVSTRAGVATQATAGVREAVAGAQHAVRQSDWPFDFRSCSGVKPTYTTMLSFQQGIELTGV